MGANELDVIGDSVNTIVGPFVGYSVG